MNIKIISLKGPFTDFTWWYCFQLRNTAYLRQFLFFRSLWPLQSILWDHGSTVTYGPWFIHQMVAHFTMRTDGVNQAFRFVEGTWLHRRSHQIRFFSEKYLVYIIRAQREMSNHLIYRLVIRKTGIKQSVTPTSTPSATLAGSKL